MIFDDLPLTALHAVMAQAEWQRLFVAISRCEPIVEPSPVVDAFFAHHGVRPAWQPQPVFDPSRLPRIERSRAERYVSVLVQRELAYGVPRLPPEMARRAAALFLESFGPTTAFYPSISLTSEVLLAKERNAPTGYGVMTGLFGSTLEEGVFAIDPAGCVGALFVGDED